MFFLNELAQAGPPAYDDRTMAHTFTDANFEQEVLKSEVPVLVDFWAEWCGPCRVMAPMIDELSHEIPETKLKIGKINVDQDPSAPEKYGVASIPTFMVFKNGEKVEEFMGSMPKAALLEKLARYTA